ncbi:hypothetical protein ACGF0D_42075 [Kitasatospora sp. NPDC048298]|uniref:hypothetical protein n=1 Tax=Kitasatospora sp. NPDC048298 TaxID=3364049 RepID=UPI00370FDFEB
MSQEEPEEPDPSATSRVENLLAGGSAVGGSVVQAGTVNGGVHVHSAARPVRPPGVGTVEVLAEYCDPVTQWVVIPADAEVTDLPVRLPGQLKGEEDVLGWARGHGGADFESTVLSVTVTNRSDAHLTLRDLRAEVLDRVEPFRGAMVRLQPAGSRNVPELELDLDQERPVLWEVDEFTRQPVGARPFLDRTHVRLAPDESERFIVTAQIRRSCCAWQLATAFRADDGTEFTVRPERRFRTTGLPVTGLGPVLAWQWFDEPPAFKASTAWHDWCSPGNPEPELPEAPRELRRLAGRFGPHLAHFLSTGTTGPEQQLRLAAALPAVRLAVDLVKAERKNRQEHAARLAAELRGRFPQAIAEQAITVALLAAGLTHGIPPANREQLTAYLTHTPAAQVLRPMIAAVARR